MSLFDLGNMLRSYVGANASSPPPNVEQDFQRVAQTVPQEHLASGLASAFNSSQTPAFPSMLSNLFGQSNGQQRAGILNELLSAAGPSIAGGLLQQFGGGGRVSPEQAQQVSPEAVEQLATHAQQQDPSVVDRASNFYAQHPQVVQALGAGALALVMSHLSQRV